MVERQSNSPIPTTPKGGNTMSVETGEQAKAIERVTELAVGWEFACISEQAVMDRFQADMDRFNANERSPELLRACVVYVDARSNLSRFQKDAQAVRMILSALSPEPQPRDEQVSLSSESG